MPKFGQQQFNKFILDNNIIGFFETAVTLKSGRISNWYVNWRRVASDTFLLEQTAEYVLHYCQDHSLTPDAFVGVPEGATPLGIITQLKYAQTSRDYQPVSHPLIISRGKPKEHGAAQDRYFIGNPQGKRIVVLEDVTTTGGSLLTTIDSLVKAGAEVIAAIGLTNRMEKRDDGQSVEEAINAVGVPYYHLGNALDLLPLAYQQLQPGPVIKAAVEAEFARYGVQSLKL